MMGDKLFVAKQKELWAAGITAIKETKKLAYAFVAEKFEILVEDAIFNKNDFVYEGHFTNHSTWDIPKKFKANGYTINMIFLGLQSPDISELRVINRVKEGGHYVARNTIEDNFFGNLEKLNLYWRILDSLDIIDTSETEHVLLFRFAYKQFVSSQLLDRMPDWFVNYLPSIFSLLPAN